MEIKIKSFTGEGKLIGWEVVGEIDMVKFTQMAASARGEFTRTAERICQALFVEFDVEIACDDIMQTVKKEN